VSRSAKTLIFLFFAIGAIESIEPVQPGPITKSTLSALTNLLNAETASLGRQRSSSYMTSREVPFFLILLKQVQFLVLLVPQKKKNHHLVEVAHLFLIFLELRLREFEKQIEIWKRKLKYILT